MVESEVNAAVTNALIELNSDEIEAVFAEPAEVNGDIPSDPSEPEATEPKADILVIHSNDVNAEASSDVIENEPEETSQQATEETTEPEVTEPVVIEPAHESLQADKDEAALEAKQDDNADDVDDNVEISTPDNATGDADPPAESTEPVIEAEPTINVVDDEKSVDVPISESNNDDDGDQVPAVDVPVSSDSNVNDVSVDEAREQITTPTVIRESTDLEVDRKDKIENDQTAPDVPQGIMLLQLD